MNSPNYSRYLKHQGSKLINHPNEVKTIDINYEKIVFERYLNYNLEGKSILCLGARLGGEVRAFKRLGAMAIGIDIQPGLNNEHVLYGDFHNINFPNAIFDHIFCNAIDHSLYPNMLFAEAKRVLKNLGIFFLEIAIQNKGPYEVIDTLDITPIIDIAKEYFDILNIDNIDNKWKGKLLILRKP